MINVGCCAPTSPVFSCRFLFVRQKHYMHQSHWRQSRRLMNADTLDGECIGVLEYRSITLSVVGREAACQISLPVFSISARLCFTHFCCHFCVYSFEVFSCAAHLNGELYFTLMCLWPKEEARLFPHTASRY